MRYHRIKCELLTAEGGSWERMAQELLSAAALRRGVVRLIFFAHCTDNEEYLLRRKLLEQWTEAAFESPRPLISFIAQKPLVGEWVLEIHSLDEPDAEVVIREMPTAWGHYLRIEAADYCEIVAGGLCGDDLHAPIYHQSLEAFEKVRRILAAEQMDWEDIVRQWNYLERITSFAQGSQRYQDFNDVRTQFYSTSRWTCGYPAATGIGTQAGGVQLDFNAVKGGIRVTPLDNDWQRAAHVYSDEVLVSNCREKGTPKFERGKQVSGSVSTQGLIYISGTAAIRGEGSVEGDILAQTRITVENIQHLIDVESSASIEFLRVYLKNEEDAAAVREEMESLCPGVPVTYLCADVCREELLIEIEGVASL